VAFAFGGDPFTLISGRVKPLAFPAFGLADADDASSAALGMMGGI
jgi:hypothetical protein